MMLYPPMSELAAKAGSRYLLVNLVARRARNIAAAAQADLFTAAEFDADNAAHYAALAFGCPSMGSEQLEDTEFEPVFTECEAKLSGKVIGLFGSYGWGDGEWMRNWEETCKNAGAVLACDSVICADAPDDDATAACKALGAALAE